MKTTTVVAPQIVQLDKHMRSFLRTIKDGQSLNLAVWSNNLLVRGEMTMLDLEKLFRLGF